MATRSKTHRHDLTRQDVGTTGKVVNQARNKIKIRNQWIDSTLIVATLLLVSGSMHARTAGSPGGAGSQRFDPRDLSGVWIMHQKAQDTLSCTPPVMTAWAQAKYDANKPGIGRLDRIVPPGNNPMMICDPIGFAQILFHVLYPVEDAQLPGRMFEFFDFFYTHRVISTDGRGLPKDPDSSWYGYSVGKWDGDTFIVDTIKFNGRSWLDSDGHPHSEDMRVEERYRRTDDQTIELNLTVVDPKAYVTPWVSETKVWKLAPKMEIREDICVPSDEEKYKEEMRVPAATPPINK